jgi:hypothetical protein
MNELDELFGRLGSDLDEGLDAAAPRAAAHARALLIDAIQVESAVPAGRHRRRRGSRRRGGPGRWSGLFAIGLTVTVTLVVLIVALRIGGHRASSSAAVPTVLPFGSNLNPSGPTGVIASTVQLAAVVPDPLGSGPAWGLKTYRVQGDMTCFQVGREQAGQIGAVGAYGSFGNDGRFHPFTLSDVGFGTCVQNDAHEHAFDNVAYANAPASASGEPCRTFAGGLPPHVAAQLRARLSAQTHAADCKPRNQRLVAFGLLGPAATSVTYRTAHGTATTPTHGPDGAYLIVEPVDPAICGSQCEYSGGGAGNEMPHVQPMRARYYCVQKGIYRPNVLRIPCDGRVPNGYARLTGGASQLMAYVSWIAREPVTNVNDSTYSIQVTNPRRCGGGAQGNSTQSLIRAGTRITRDIEVSSRCAGTYQGTVLYQPSLGPAGQAGIGLPQPGIPGVYVVGRFSIAVR